MTSILFLTSLQCQIAQNSAEGLNELDFFIHLNNTKYDNVEGSKYLFDEFRPAKINTIKTTHLVRFDVLEHIIELKKSESEIMGLSKNKTYSVTLLDGSNRIFLTKDFQDDDKQVKNGIFEQLHQNQKFILFKRSRIKFQKAKPIKSSYEKAVPAKFIPLEDVFYVSFGKNEEYSGLIKVPQKKKALKLFFGKYFAEIEKLVKEEKLKFDLEQDLIKIFNYYVEIRKE